MASVPDDVTWGKCLERQRERITLLISFLVYSPWWNVTFTFTHALKYKFEVLHQYLPIASKRSYSTTSEGDIAFFYSTTQTTQQFIKVSSIWPNITMKCYLYTADASIIYNNNHTQEPFSYLYKHMTRMDTRLTIQKHKLFLIVILMILLILLATEMSASSIKLTCLEAWQSDRQLTYLQLSVLHQYVSIGHFWRRLTNP